MTENSFVSGMTSEVEELLRNIDESIHYIELDANKKGQNPYTLKHIDGTFVMERLLFAKAQALHTLVMLKTRRTYG